MVRKEMIAMLLAGGQGSRLGVLTSEVAKPAVSFGGKYSIIDQTILQIPVHSLSAGHVTVHKSKANTQVYHN